MPVSRTVVISCAGMGRRLGMDTTKALVEVDGVPLIIRHLRMLDEVDDVRVVVGYQAQRVIDCVRAYRDDVTFVFNHEYRTTGTGASVMRAARFAGDYVLTLDGDLLINPADMRQILAQEDEFIGVTTPGSDGPVLTDVADGKVTEFSREHGTYEWTGVMQVRTDRLTGGEGHVYQLIEQYLPMPYLFIRTKEIDTVNDFDNAERWVKNGYRDDAGDVVGIVGGMGSYATVDLFRRLVDAFPARYEWDRPRILIDNHCTMPSRVRAILYGERRGELVELLAQSTRDLLSAGATKLLYACNTSHVFLPEVCRLVPDAEGALLDMIDLLGRDLAEAGVGEAYLLASEGTIQTGIYQDRFARYGVGVEAADDEQQVALRDFIEVVKQNKVTPAEREHFRAYVAGLGRKVVVLGCTELPILWDGGAGVSEIPGVAVVDPIQSVIDELVRTVHLAEH